MQQQILRTGAALIVTFGLASAAFAQEVKWDMPNEYAENSLAGFADKDFIRLVAEKTDGSIQIEPFFGGSLGYKSSDHFNAVQDGAVPLAHTFGGALSGIDPVFQTNTLPFLVSNPDEMLILINTIRPYVNEVFQNAGQRLLFVQPMTPVGIWSKRPVLTIDDLRELKIRTYDVNGTVALKAAGSNPVQLSWGDVIPALSTNLIDSVLTSDEGGISASFWDYTSYFNRLNFTAGLDVVHINEEAFEALTSEQQEAVLAAAAEAENMAWGRVKVRVAENTAKMVTNNVTVVENISPELIALLRASGKEATDNWLEAMAGKGEKIIGEYMARIAK